MREEKKLLLKEIADKIGGSKAFFIARHQGINPNQASAFRINVSASGGEYEVVRKRIFMKAAKSSGLAVDESILGGHIGLIFANVDPIETTKVIFSFCKENEGMLKVVGGLFEGRLCSAKDIEVISKLPSKDEMRAQLLSVFESPLSQTLAVMESLMTSVVYCLANKSEEEKKL